MRKENQLKITGNKLVVISMGGGQAVRALCGQDLYNLSILSKDEDPAFIETIDKFKEPHSPPYKNYVDLGTGSDKIVEAVKAALKSKADYVVACVVPGIPLEWAEPMIQAFKSLSQKYGKPLIVASKDKGNIRELCWKYGLPHANEASKALVIPDIVAGFYNQRIMQNRL